MRVLWLLCCALCWATGCAPEQECGGALYYDPGTVSCRPCPSGSTPQGGSCQCAQDYEFVGSRCVLRDGAVAAVPDAGSCDADAGVANGCNGYCSFVAACIADNAIAALGLSDVISGLHADDAALCEASCEGDVGCIGVDPVTACVAAGRQQAACVGDDTQAGLERTLGLLGTCCGDHQDNKLCQSICSTLKANAFLADNVPYCP